MTLEETIQALRTAGDLSGAATKTVEGYGPEVFGYLVTVLRDERDASEVFSQTCEDLWRGLSRFDGRCTMRTWFYVLARNAKARFRRSPHQQPARHARLSEATDLAERVRSQTLPHLRTSIKDRFAAIRDSLDEEDRSLLVLRVDREMSWREIALTYSTDDVSADALRRLEARLGNDFRP